MIDLTVYPVSHEVKGNVAIENNKEEENILNEEQIEEERKFKRSYSR